MDKDDKNPEGEQEQETTETDETPDEESDSSDEQEESKQEKTLSKSDDPFDQIDDPEELRRIAKEERSKRQRLGKKTDTKTEAKSDDTLRRSDFEKENERLAIEMATTPSGNDSDDLVTLKQDIERNWDEIRKHYRPTSRLTKESIYEDILDAHALWKRRGGGTTRQTNAALAAVHGKGGTSPKPSTKKERFLPKTDGGLAGLYKKN